MPFKLASLSLAVLDQDAALAFYIDKLGFTLRSDEAVSPAKRMVKIAPPGGGAQLILAKAKTPEQAAIVGNQSGGRVFLFLETDHFARDFEIFTAKGVIFDEPPREEVFGTVAIFRDLYGNKLELIERK